MKDNKNTVQRKTKPDWNKLTKEDLQKLEIAEEIGVIDKIYAEDMEILHQRNLEKLEESLLHETKQKKRKNNRRTAFITFRVAKIG